MLPVLCKFLEYFVTWIVFVVCHPRVFATHHLEFCEDPGDEVNCICNIKKWYLLA